MHLSLPAFLLAALLLGLPLVSHAEPPDETLEPSAADPVMPPNQMPDWGLSGDWSGSRNDLAARGILLDLRATQIGQGVVDGGRRDGFETSGSAMLEATVDFGRLASWPGASFHFMAEDVWGKSVNQRTGMFTGVNIDTLLPVVNDRSAGFTRGYFMQALSPRWGLYLGRIDTFEGDRNEYAHGRGETQFLNPSLTFNPVTSALTPYSAWGGGAYYLLPDNGGVGTFTVLDANGRADRLGLDNAFEDGVTLVTEWRFSVSPFGLPGHQFFGANYTTDNQLRLDTDPVYNFGALGPVPVKQDDGWSLRWNFDQVIWQDDQDTSRSLGLFGRLGLADDRMNAAESFASFGATLRQPFGLLAGDELAMGFFRIGPSDQIADPFDVGGNESGVEAYYKLNLTDDAALTFDLQHVSPAIRSIDNSLVTGIRLVLSL